MQYQYHITSFLHQATARPTSTLLTMLSCASIKCFPTIFTLQIRTTSDQCNAVEIKIICATFDPNFHDLRCNLFGQGLDGLSHAHLF